MATGKGCSPMAQRIMDGSSKTLSIDFGLPILKEVNSFPGNLPADIYPNVLMIPVNGPNEVFPFHGVGIQSGSGVLVFYTSNELRKKYRDVHAIREAIKACKINTHRCLVEEVCMLTLGEGDETTYDNIYSSAGLQEQRFIPSSEVEDR